MTTGMKPSHRYLRIVWAWGLLSILCLQRVIGLIGSEFNITHYVVEDVRQMSHVGKMISERIGSATGVYTKIDVLHESSEDAIHETGYSAPMVMTAEIDGEKVEYVFAKATQLTIEYINLNDILPVQDEKKAPSPKPTKSKILSDFQLTDQLVMNDLDLSSRLRTFSTEDLHKSPFLPISVPPPETV